MLWIPLCSFHGDHKLFINGTGDGLGTWEQRYSRFLSSCKYSHNGGNSLQFTLNVILSHFFSLVFYLLCNSFALFADFLSIIHNQIFSWKNCPSFVVFVVGFFFVTIARMSMWLYGSQAPFKQTANYSRAATKVNYKYVNWERIKYSLNIRHLLWKLSVIRYIKDFPSICSCGISL